MTLALVLLLDVSLCFLFFVLIYLVLLSLPTTPIPLRPLSPFFPSPSTALFTRRLLTATVFLSPFP